MLITKRIGNALLALTLTAAVAGCTATPAPTPSASSTPTRTPTATTLSPAEQDLVNAKQAVVKLWAVIDRLTNDPKSSIQDLDAVASGEVLKMFQRNLVTYRTQGWTGSGSAVVESPTAEVAGINERGLTTWTVTACVNRTKTTLTDSQGKSVQMPPYRIRHRSTVVGRAGTFEVDQDEAIGTC